MDETETTQGGTGQTRELVLGYTLDVRNAPESDGTIDDQLVRLMNKHEQPIYNFLLALLRDADAALDCAQDTFFRAYENLRKGKPVQAQWLYTVARNRAMDEFRRRQRVQPDLDRLEQVPIHESRDQIVAVQAGSALSL
jgi:DNA-directed RNA polymerase specialized sigma24 family protein